MNYPGKLLAILTILAMLIVLETGCSDETDNTDTDSDFEDLNFEDLNATSPAVDPMGTSAAVNYRCQRDSHWSMGNPTFLR